MREKSLEQKVKKWETLVLCHEPLAIRLTTKWVPVVSWPPQMWLYYLVEYLKQYNDSTPTFNN